MKKGFTLIELISVLSVLTILSLIIVPIMSNVINNSKNKAFETQKQSLITAAQKYAMEISEYLPMFKGNKYTITLNELKDKSYIEDVDILDPKTDKPLKGCIELTYGSDKKFDYKYVDVCQNYPQAPILEENMIPVKYSNGKYVTVGNGEWYDYGNREWANAAIVEESSLRDYKEATEQIEVQNNDIIGIFVWIPRYSYSIQTKNAAGVATYGYNSTNIDIPGSIAIKFTNHSTTDIGVGYYLGDVDTNFRTHDAFYSDLNNDGERQPSEELPGFWISKFKAGELSPSRMSYEKYLTYFVQGLTTTVNQDIESQYKLARNFAKNNNIEFESKMLSNKEYGAITYLSQSIYGRCTSKTTCPKFTRSTSNITGGGSAIESNTLTSTGNVTGVFDLSGGVQERVLATFETPFAFDIKERNYDKYTTNARDTACNGEKCLGHALDETYGWGTTQTSVMPDETRPYMLRGGSSLINNSNIFYFTNDIGITDNNIGFRISLKVG